MVVHFDRCVFVSVPCTAAYANCFCKYVNKNHVEIKRCTVCVCVHEIEKESMGMKGIDDSAEFKTCNNVDTK